MASSQKERLDKIIADARRHQDERAKGYRERAMKLYPWVCGRCAREFEPKNLRELTVHHKDHDHDNNPADGSNWELLCMYCHDNEHQRQEAALYGDLLVSAEEEKPQAMHNPFAGLKDMLGKDD